MLTESFERFRRTITIRLLCRPAALIGRMISWRCSLGGKKTATSANLFPENDGIGWQTSLAFISPKLIADL
jgi:hypothetical protein